MKLRWKSLHHAPLLAEEAEPASPSTPLLMILQSDINAPIQIHCSIKILIKMVGMNFTFPAALGTVAVDHHIHAISECTISSLIIISQGLLPKFLSD